MAEWGKKRFWEQTSVDKAEGGYAVLLDGRRLHTPAKSRLIVPSREMAEQIAAEWQAQGEQIDPTTMPFTRSANAAIDKVAPMHDEVAALVAEYGGSDLLCYRADSPKELCQLQQAAWDPLLQWAAQELGAPLKTATGVMHVAQDADVLGALHQRVRGMSAFQLAAFHDLVGISGSLIIGFAVVFQKWPPEQLWTFSRVDEDWQIAQWGEDDEASATAAAKKADFLHAATFYFMAN